MAQSRGRKTSSGKKSNTSSRKKKKNVQQYENTIIDEVFFLLSLAITILLFLCNFHIIGTLGNILSSFMFGLFGYMAYVAPLLIFFGVCFWIANLGNPVATIKLISGFVLFCMLCVCFTLIGGIANIGSSISDFYHFSADNLKGGGIIGGFLGNGMYQMLGMVGTVIILIVLILICIVLLTEHSFRNKIKNGGAILADYVKDDFQRKREYAQERNDERMLQREKRKEEQRLLAEADKELRMNKKVSGIANASELNIKPVKTTAAGRQSQPVDMEELSQKVLKEQAEADKSQAMEALSKIRIRGIDDSNIGDVSTRELGPEIGQKKNSPEADVATPAPVRERKTDSKPRMTESASESTPAVYPAQSLSDEIIDTIVDYTRKLAKSLHVIGLINIQFIVTEDGVYVIEVNPRSSRTVPYISKVTSIPIVDLATHVILGAKITDLGYKPGLQDKADYIAIKMPVFSFEKIRGADTCLGPEMKSTGECLGIAKTFDEALYKAFLGAGVNLPKHKKMIITVNDADKHEAISIGKRFEKLGYEIYATRSTAKVLNENGVNAIKVNKLSQEAPTVIDLLLEHKIDIVVDTPTQGRDKSRDGFLIRRISIETGVNCFTSLDTVNALLTSLESNVKDNLSVIDIAQI